MNNINKLRRLMFAANYLKRENPVILKGQTIDNSRALKYAWYFENLRTKLRSGIWRFSYFKKDGGIREARGTLDFSLIPEEHRPKTLSAAPRDSAENYATFPYYDLDKNDWRSFRLDLFIGFITQER